MGFCRCSTKYDEWPHHSRKGPGPPIRRGHQACAAVTERPTGVDELSFRASTSSIAAQALISLKSARAVFRYRTRRSESRRIEIATIASVQALEILNSRGNPTVRVVVELDDGAVATPRSPVGFDRRA